MKRTITATVLALAAISAHADPQSSSPAEKKPAQYDPRLCYFEGKAFSVGSVYNEMLCTNERPVSKGMFVAMDADGEKPHDAYWIQLKSKNR